MKRKIFTFLLSLAWAVSFFWFVGCSGKKDESSDEDPYFDVFIPQMGEQAYTFACKQGLNENYCLLVDYAIPSGQPRVFVWSFAKKQIVFQAHTMHGPGGGSTKAKAVLSNVSGSNCSASGPFAITREHGTVNPDGFFLRGLPSENWNARARAMMLMELLWLMLP